MDEFFSLLQYVENLIYTFYDDPYKTTTRIHVCQLGNVSGKIGNTHSFWHIIPRTSKTIILNLKNEQITFEDIYWGTSFNNNVKYEPSDQLLDHVREKYIKLIEQMPTTQIDINVNGACSYS